MPRFHHLNSSGSSHIRLEGQPKALVHKGAGDALTVRLAYALSAGHLIPPLPHGCLHVGNDTGCLSARQEEAFALGEQILRLRAAAPVPADHRKIASLETHHDRWGEVVRWRELPILVHGDHGVIARMIVKVGTERGE